MLLATPDDVSQRLRRDLTDDEVDWVGGLLEEASIAVEAFCRRQFTEPVPDNVRVVASRVAARGLDNAVPTGQESKDRSAGPYAESLRFTSDASSGGVWLTKADKSALKPFQESGGAFSIAMAPGEPPEQMWPWQ